MLDSAAVLVNRALEIGILPAELSVIAARGWDNFGTFALSCGPSPGGPYQARLLRLAAIITEVCALDPPEERMPAIRRLNSGAYTMAAADMKIRLEASDDVRPRKLTLRGRRSATTRYTASAA